MSIQLHYHPAAFVRDFVLPSFQVLCCKRSSQSLTLFAVLESVNAVEKAAISTSGRGIHVALQAGRAVSIYIFDCPDVTEG